MIREINQGSRNQFKKIIITFSNYERIKIFPNEYRIEDENGSSHYNVDFEIICCKSGVRLSLIVYEYMIKSESNIIRIEVEKV